MDTVTNDACALGLEVNNAILTPSKRVDNLRKLYEELPRIAATVPDLSSAVLAMHAIALDGADFSLYAIGELSNDVRAQIGATGCISAGKFRSVEAGSIVGIRGIHKVNLPPDEFHLWIPSPQEKRLPLLLSLFFEKVEKMLSETDDDEQVSLIVLWASQIFLLLHPFYDGNGRVTRAFSTLLLLRKKKMPQVIEVQAELLTPEIKRYLWALYQNFLIRIYLMHLAETDNLDFLPQYMRSAGDDSDEFQLEVMDLLGEKGNDPCREQRIRDRQTSLQALFELHLRNVEIADLYELIAEEELAWFKTKPGAFTL